MVSEWDEIIEQAVYAERLRQSVKEKAEKFIANVARTPTGDSEDEKWARLVSKEYGIPLPW